MSGGLISVHTEVVRQTIVGRVVELVREESGRVGDEPPVPLDALARAGYDLRGVERRLFAPARRAMPGLDRELSERTRRGATRAEAIAELSRELADAEPLERPDPDDAGVASWRVPGPGGHVRHYVAVELAGEGPPERKRDVMYGFFVRCCEEALGA